MCGDMGPRLIERPVQPQMFGSGNGTQIQAFAANFVPLMTGRAACLARGILRGGTASFLTEGQTKAVPLVGLTLMVVPDGRLMRGNSVSPPSSTSDR